MASTRGSVEHTPRPLRGPWEGENKIVIGIDIGTTQSGVAFTYLQKGANQIVHRVTRWPGQEAQAQQSKIPSIVWYNSGNKAVSFGAEALSHEAELSAEDQGWRLAKHFKLHLHPEDMKTKHELKLRPLPVGVPLRQIYSDFLGYLLRQTKQFFEERVLDGVSVWDKNHSSMEVVLAHPNGWGIREQTFLRLAAVDAGLAEPASASSKIRFVTEAEASVHFCIYHTSLGSCLQPGTNFVVCDAGGSTVDTTLYSVVSARPVLKLEEKRASACVQAGAIFVDDEAEKYLQTMLKSAQLSEEDVEEYTKAGLKDFEGFAKRAFKDPSADLTIAVGQSRFNNSAIRARRGRLTLPGSIVKSFFDICTKEILGSVDQQIDGLDVPYILLVGGFGDSPFLREEFKRSYDPRGCQVTLTNDSTSKAVADGAVMWSTLSNVSSRAPRFSFGVVVSTMFDPDDPAHLNRMKTISADGIPRVVGAWCPIVPKGVAMDANAVRREEVHRLYSSANPNLEDLTLTLFSYSGGDTPDWALDEDGGLGSGFKKSCTVTANLQNLSSALTRGLGLFGNTYWSLGFDVCIKFGGTELQAYLEWKENGIIHTGPATLISESTVDL
ncbi:heat shock protein 70 kDa 12B [Ceratobasidium sp. AG-Ba]|nr:heat shock protein 70 kDa 12B [Ceratobasidium sp. AG-Ba]